MARIKKSSKVIEGAQKRYAGIKSIASNLDLGNGMTLVRFGQAISATQAALASYHSARSAADAAQNAFVGAERGLRDLSERMLTGVATKYGKDSSEYEVAGGTRKSERKRRARKVKIVSKA